MAKSILTRREEQFLLDLTDDYSRILSPSDILFIIHLYANTEFCHKMNGEPNDYLFYRRLECKLRRIYG